MNHKRPRVEFRLFSLGNDDAKGLLPPEGTVVFQYLGFPHDFDDCTYIPVGPVAFWARTGVTEFDAQWYKQTQGITREDIPPDLCGSTKIKDHLFHQPRLDRNSYPISTLHVDGKEVQVIAFVGKRLLFKRLGHDIELDLQHIPENQRFTLAVEWGFNHIEVRVTWLEGEGLDKYFTGRGISYEQISEYKYHQVGEIVQFKARKEFETTLLPVEVARAVWQQSKDTISDTDVKGRPNQEFGSPRKVYSDSKDFQQTLLMVFGEIKQILMKTKPHAFWNGKTPKSEPDAGTSLRLLLEAICSYKNIRVYQEDPGRSGDVDFVFSGISKEMDHLELILEIKNAHSNRIERGLTHQLPQYLIEHQADCGVYGILWYKGRFFDNPTDETIDICLMRLKDIKPKEIDDVIGFDVSFPIQASKL